MDDLLSEFLTETSENLAVLDVELVKHRGDTGWYVQFRHQVGFDDYVAKYDREGLVHTLNETLAEVRGAA